MKNRPWVGGVENDTFYDGTTEIRLYKNDGRATPMTTEEQVAFRRQFCDLCSQYFNCRLNGDRIIGSVNLIGIEGFGACRDEIVFIREP